MRLPITIGLAAAALALAFPALATDLRKDGTLIYDTAPDPVLAVASTGLRKDGTLIYDTAPDPVLAVASTGLRKDGTLIYDTAPPIEVQCALLAGWTAFPLAPMPAPMLPAAWRGVF